MSTMRQLVKARYNELNTKPITQIDEIWLREMQLLLADYKKKKVCTWCDTPYKLKDFKTRADKDERELSGFCQNCIDKTFSGNALLRPIQKTILGRNKYNEK